MNAYLFDVDGVLNNMVDRKISKPEIIVHLVTLLRNGSPLGFISGRGLLWLRSQVIKLIEEYVAAHPVLAKTLLDQVFVSGEFGGVTSTHSNGERIETVNKAFIIPAALRKSLTECANQFAEYIYIETEKQTVFSTPANEEISEEAFTKEKQEIIKTFTTLLQDYPNLEVQTDRLAINVKYKKANKKYATSMFVAWLEEKGLRPEKYFAFGDSPTDLEMGAQLQAQKLPFTFIFVGEQSELQTSQHTFPVTITKGHCDEGTLEYLSQHGF